LFIDDSTETEDLMDLYRTWKCALLPAVLLLAYTTGSTVMLYVGYSTCRVDR
jgi:hypothetical protein